jgi:hypothetical protein
MIADKQNIIAFATKHGKTIDTETEVQNLDYAAIVTVNFKKGAIANINQLTGNVEIDLKNVPNGGSGTMVLKQDAVGSRLLVKVKHADLNEKFRGNGTLTTTPGKVDLLRYERIGNALYLSLDKNY